MAMNYFREMSHKHITYTFGLFLRVEKKLIFLISQVSQKYVLGDWDGEAENVYIC